MEETVFQHLSSTHKVILLMGARQVGKTTLLGAIQARLIQDGKSVRYLNCDLEEERQSINTTSRIVLNRLIEGMDALLVDEVQRLDNPGLTLKILHDLYPQLMILATGSSSFELRNRTSEAMTGRYIDLHLAPLSMHELLQHSGVWDDRALRKPSADALLENVLCYGLYPEIYLEGNPATKQLLLSRLVESYLFKDILAYQRIRNSQAITNLARALAYQIGNEVNENELANRLKIDRKTVVSYVEILEKSFVIVRIPPFSRNPRREIGKQSKIYFMDLGIRNALIGDFNDLSLRADRGAIWENFLIIERLKAYFNQNRSVQGRFWRAYNGAEVDYIEEAGIDKIQAFEIKAGEADLGRSAKAFIRLYSIDVQVVNQENYLDFISLD